MFTSNLQVDMGTAAQSVAKSLTPVVKKLNEMLSTGRLQPIINGFVAGFQWLAAAGNVLADALGWVADNMNWLGPVFVGVGSTLLIYTGITKGAAIATTIMSAIVATATGNWLQLGAAVVGAVGGLMAANALAQQMDKITKDANGTLSMDFDEKALADRMTALEMPVTVANEPVKVKGEVDISKQCLDYYTDLAKRDYVVRVNNQTPQMVVNGMTIKEEADIRRIFQQFSTFVKEAARTTGEGVA